MHALEMNDKHEKFMKIALHEAQLAQEKDEVPVGAVLVNADGEILARGHNQTATRCDPTAHAEIVVLRQAGVVTGNYRLLSTTLYATIEPCVMCMGALIHARVAQIVFGAPDPKWGAAGSLYDFSQDKRFNHQPEIISGIFMDTCRELMRNFFKRKREQR
jgi:tRNA(adenine34) deaminase